MNWISLDLATSLIGGLAGLIFFFDGWKRNPKELLPFSKTPRITGFVWVVGGGVISGLLTYVAKSDQSRAMIVYISSFCLMVLASLIVAAASMAVYYVLKHYGQQRLKGAVTDAIPFTLFFLANGLDATLERLAETEQKATALAIAGLERSRLYALQFINDVNAFINDDIKGGRKGRDHFKFFLATNLRTFVLMFFEEKEILEKYRAAFFERQDKSLVFTEGADVIGSDTAFGGEPLGIDTSLAGRALRDNRILYFPEDSGLAFERLSGGSPYKRFVVLPVPYKVGSAETERIGVLSIDSTEENTPFQAQFQKRLLIYFSNVIAGAHTIYVQKPSSGRDGVE